MIRINRPECPNPSALGGGNYKHPENKAALIEASYGKCMYCESEVTSIYYGDIEHIKPKSKFPDLEFDWTNLGFVCAKCNGAKSDKFSETLPYLNPYGEDPENHVVFGGAIAMQKRGSERGELTIIDIDLNRPGLIEQRNNRYESVKKVIDRCFRSSPELRELALEEIKKEAKKDKEYSSMIKCLFIMNGIGEFD